MRPLARAVALRILLALVSTAVVLGTLEGGARIIRARSAPAGGLPWLEFSSQIGWQGRPGSRSDAYAAERQFDRDGLFTVDSRGVTPEGRRGKRLILLLGDSRTFGNGVPVDDTYGQVLERRLPGLEVVNRAFPGYSSLQGLIALEADAPRFRPDVVVFAFDFNDRRYVLHPSEADSRDRFRHLARLDTWDRLTSWSALVGLAAGRRAPGPDHARDRALDLATVLPRVSPDDFRGNLAAAAKYCSRHGIQLVFLVLNDNVAESRELEDGARASRARRAGDAEALWRAAVDRNNVFSEAARLQLSLLYAETGRPRDAAVVRVSPRTFYSLAGGFPIRPGEEYRTIIREVATQAGVRLVDAGSEIDRRPASYFDFCHFDREGHRIVADLLADHMGGPEMAR